MLAKITYVYHNCFILNISGHVLVFDYPDKEHRNGRAESVVREALAGADAYIFFSHSHPDHCSPEILDLTREAANATYVLSFDVPDMIPELDLPGAVVIEPEGEEYLAGDLTVTGLESTDLGVAFLIRMPEVLVYFGGDLAEWTWENIQGPALDRERAYFEECLAEIAAFGPDIAFANLDLRLPGLAGGPKFVNTVRPKVYVPMHGFGDTEGLARAAAGIHAPETRVFIYRETGESMEINL